MLFVFVCKQCDSSDDSLPISPTRYNSLEEPSSLGLRLRKSLSLLDLIQMRLSQQQDPKKKYYKFPNLATCGRVNTVVLRRACSNGSPSYLQTTTTIPHHDTRGCYSGIDLISKQRGTRESGGKAGIVWSKFLCSHFFFN